MFLRTLGKEQYSQAEIDHLFTVLVSPNFIYGLPVYGASEPDLIETLRYPEIGERVTGSAMFFSFWGDVIDLTR